MLPNAELHQFAGLNHNPKMAAIAPMLAEFFVRGSAPSVALREAVPAAA